MILAIALTLVSGVIQGRMSDRWGPPPALRAAADKLKELPSQFGGWRLASTEKMSQDVVNMLECEGYLFGTYVNDQTGETVRASIMLGPSGPISVHTPEICYSSREYTIDEDRHQVPLEIPGSKDKFWALTFRSNNLDANTLRVYYAWNANGSWTAPNDARFAFASCPFLYKIQLAGNASREVASGKDDPCYRFLEDFVPAIRSCLVKAS